MSKLKLAICSPAYGGQINAAQARMWTEIGNAVGASSERFRLTMFGFVDVNPVDRARNQALAHAMLHSSDWLFSIDADTWIEHSADEDAGFQMLRMISDADRAGAVLVSAPVVKRADETQMLMVAKGLDAYELAVYGKPGEDGKHKAVSGKWALTQQRRLVSTIDNGTTPIWAVGAACYAVNLNKLVKIEPPAMYRFTDMLSEDLDFCAQIRAKFGDGAIMVDPRVKTGHAGRSFPLFSHLL
jgi:hypothetical protein